MVIYRFGVISLSLLLFFGSIGCTSEKVIRREAAESPYLEATLSSQKDNVRRQAVEAHFQGQRLYVKYTFNNTTYYAAGKWKVPDGPAGLPELKTGASAGGLALPLEQHGTMPWKNLPEDADPLLVLGSETWDVLIAQVFDTILPVEPLTGVIVDTFTREYFLYSDEKNRSRITYLATKPDRIGIDRVWTFSQLLDLAIPYLENYLAQNGIEDRQVHQYQ